MEGEQQQAQQEKVKVHLTTIEAAEIAGITVGYVRQLLASGRLRGEKWGRDWRIRRVELERWLDTR